VSQGPNGERRCLDAVIGEFSRKASQIDQSEREGISGAQDLKLELWLVGGRVQAVEIECPQPFTMSDQ